MDNAATAGRVDGALQTAVASPSRMPAPAATFTQMTQGGCCVQPFFSPDSSLSRYPANESMPPR